MVSSIDPTITQATCAELTSAHVRKVSVTCRPIAKFQVDKSLFFSTLISNRRYGALKY